MAEAYAEGYAEYKRMMDIFQVERIAKMFQNAAKSAYSEIKQDLGDMVENTRQLIMDKLNPEQDWTQMALQMRASINEDFENKIREMGPEATKDIRSSWTSMNQEFDQAMQKAYTARSLGLEPDPSEVTDVLARMGASNCKFTMEYNQAKEQAHEQTREQETRAKTAPERMASSPMHEQTPMRQQEVIFMQPQQQQFGPKIKPFDPEHNEIDKLVKDVYIDGTMSFKEANEKHFDKLLDATDRFSQLSQAAKSMERSLERSAEKVMERAL